MPAEHTTPEGDLIIDVRARAEDGSPVEPARAEPAASARPVFEQRTFSGRVFPGGPAFQGQTWVFRSGGPGNNDGRGCCGCGLVVFALLMIVFVRGCASFFN